MWEEEWEEEVEKKHQHHLNTSTPFISRLHSSQHPFPLSFCPFVFTVFTACHHGTSRHCPSPPSLPPITAASESCRGAGHCVCHHLTPPNVTTGDQSHSIRLNFSHHEGAGRGGEGEDDEGACTCVLVSVEGRTVRAGPRQCDRIAIFHFARIRERKAVQGRGVRGVCPWRGSGLSTGPRQRVRTAISRRPSGEECGAPSRLY